MYSTLHISYCQIYYKYIYIYIYIYIVLFGPVKPELGVIPSGQENHSKAEHSNFPGRELNVILNFPVRGLNVNRRIINL